MYGLSAGFAGLLLCTASLTHFSRWDHLFSVIILKAYLRVSCSLWFLKGILARCLGLVPCFAGLYLCTACRTIVVGITPQHTEFTYGVLVSNLGKVYGLDLLISCVSYLEQRVSAKTHHQSPLAIKVLTSLHVFPALETFSLLSFRLFLANLFFYFLKDSSLKSLFQLHLAFSLVSTKSNSTFIFLSFFWFHLHWFSSIKVH